MLAFFQEQDDDENDSDDFELGDGVVTLIDGNSSNRGAIYRPRSIQKVSSSDSSAHCGKPVSCSVSAYQLPSVSALNSYIV